MYFLGDELGNGSYGYVKEAIHKKTKTKVAIKMVANLFLDNIDTKRILREIDLLSSIKNEFVVELLDIIYDNSNPRFDRVFLVFEWAPCDLKKLFYTPCFIKIDDMEKIIYKILCGLNYIHSCSVLHRDLKPSNILLQDNYAIKICDFGLARSILSDVDCLGKIDPNQMDADTNSKIIGSTKGSSSGKSLLKFMKKKDSTTNASIKIESGNLERYQNIVNNKPKELKQVLSHHVVTRWYRAPELILIQNNYTSAIDVWSLGCIFGELMTLIKENCINPYDRKPLFPGKSCFPLSPPRDQSNIQRTNNAYPVDSRDQLNLIFDVIGTPSDDDVSFITDKHAKEYLKSFGRKGKKNLKERFVGSTEESLDLLSKMIEFNPYKRITINESFNHPFFKNVRDLRMEKISNYTLNLDYENLDLTVDELRTRFVEVINKFKYDRMNTDDEEMIIDQ